MLRAQTSPNSRAPASVEKHCSSSTSDVISSRALQNLDDEEDCCRGEIFSIKSINGLEESCNLVEEGFGLEVVETENADDDPTSKAEAAANSLNLFILIIPEPFVA